MADGGNLPLAILCLGGAAVAGFMAARPWPQASGKPIKAGAYVVDVLKGQPPPAGPQAFSDAEVNLTETGLVTLVAIWAASKVASGIQGFVQGAQGGASSEEQQAEGDLGDLGEGL